MGSDLKPCPFCAHAPQLDAARRKDAETWWVECHNCSSGGPSLPSEREALTAWNDVSTATARAEAAEQRAEALEREVARLRADRAVLMAAGLVGSNAGRTLPPNCLPMLVRLSAEVVAIVGSDDREALGAYVEALLLAEAHAAGEVSDG